MKKYVLLLAFVILFTLCSCDVDTSSHAPSVRYEFVEEKCEVISVKKESKFAGTWHKTATIEVFCQKYNTTKTFQSHSQGIFATNNAWNLEEGDEVMVRVKKKVRNGDDAILEVYLLNITNYNP